jgi:hypothetical protein
MVAALREYLFFCGTRFFGGNFFLGCLISYDELGPIGVHPIVAFFGSLFLTAS